MADFKLQPNPAGSGQFTLQPPNSNNNQTVTLPDATTTLVGTDATQTLTNKTIQGGALTLETAKSATGTFVDFLNIPSWVKRITIMLNGVSTTGTAKVMFQLGTSSGIDATNYAYSAVDTSNANAIVGVTSSISGGFQTELDSAAFTGTGLVTLMTMGSNIWVASAVLISPGYAGTFQMGGIKTLSGVLDRVRITTANGTDTFDAGTINIMYEG